MKDPDLRFQAFRISKQAQIRNSTLQQIFQACNLAIYNHFDEDENIPADMIEAIAALHSLIEPMLQPSPAQIEQVAKSLGMGGILGNLQKVPRGPRR
ncbi:MAG: hypothetical protein ACLQMF_20060 [Rectinemataceae bacterium]